jgi:hypothetical protein
MGRELTVNIHGAQVQNAWSYTSPFPYIVMSVDKFKAGLLAVWSIIQHLTGCSNDN